MSVLSVSSKWKNLANQAILQARGIEEEQKNIEFRRELLSNIRQHRIAEAQLNAYNESDDVTTSSGAGAMANINSAFAGELKYTYETTERAQEIQNLQRAAQEYASRYQSQVKRASKIAGTIGSITQTVGSFFGPIGQAIAYVGTAGTIALMGGGSVAQKAALQSSVKSGLGSAIGSGIGNLFGGTTAATTGSAYVGGSSEAALSASVASRTGFERMSANTINANGSLNFASVGF